MGGLFFTKRKLSLAESKLMYKYNPLGLFSDEAKNLGDHFLWHV